MLDGTTEVAMMEIVRVLLILEISLALIALVLVAIRAFGPASVRRGLIRSIVATKSALHIF